MRSFKSVLVLMVAGAVVASCSTSNNVVNNHLISKRKYTKGFHFNKKGHFGSSEGEDVAKNNGKDVVEDQLKVSEDKTAFTTRNSANDKIQEIESRVQPEARQVASTTEKPSGKSSQVNNQSTEIPVLTDKMNAESSQQNRDLQEQTKAPLPGVDTGDPLMLIIAIILCLILPPVALGVFRGIDSIFWIDLILFILAIGGFFLIGGLSSIAGLAAVILAFLGVFDVI